MTPLHWLADSEIEPGGSGSLVDAIAEINAVTVVYAEVAAHRAQMLGWAAEHPDALYRSCLAAHFTSSALVLDASGSAVLLLHHRKLQRWLQPGGHADGQGHLAASALREATEETGIAGLRVAVPAIDLDIHAVNPPKEGRHLHLDVRFLVVAPAAAEPVGNHESTALRWVPRAELDQYELDPGLHRLVAAALAAFAAF